MKSLSKTALAIDGQPMFKYLDQAKQLESQGKSMIHLEIGDPDFSTPTNIVEAAVKSLNEGRTHYCSSYGVDTFKTAIQFATKRSRGFEPGLNQILVTPGANIGIFYAVYCLVDPGMEVIVPDPGFPTYYSTIKMCGAVPVHVPLREKNQFRMNPKDIEAAITPKTRLIIINNPNNPTGSVMTSHEIREVYQIASKHDLYLYTDEIYSRMNYDQAGFSSPSLYDRCQDRVILSNGFSKAFAMTGWRLGAMVGPEKVIERMGMLLQTTSSCVAPFLQDAGTEAILGPQSEVYAMMDEYKARRDMLVDGLNAIPGITCLSPGGAFYVFPNITKTGLTSERYVKKLMNAGVVTLPGNCFGEYGEGYVRLCYANSQDNIREALNRIRSVHESLRLDS